MQLDILHWKVRFIVQKSEIIIYNGHRYRRYPESKHPHHRKYFYGTEPRRGFLHRHIWEDEIGPIPPKYEIHHKDENTLNNDISNFECILCSDHRAEHLSKRSKTEKHQKHMIEARKKAVDWHKSDQGRKWHSEMIKSTWNKRKKVKKKCEHCGCEYETPFPSRSKFCSPKCQNQSWYEANC